MSWFTPPVAVSPGISFEATSSLVPSNITTGSEKVIRRVYGRCRVKPVLIGTWNKYAKGDYFGFPQLNSDYAWAFGSQVDAILAIAQAGITIRGVWRGDDFAGLRLVGGTWTSNGVTVEDALKRLSCYSQVGGYWTHDNTTTSSVWVSGTNTYAPIEVVTAASGTTWGRKMSSAAAWSDLVGGTSTTPPAWAHLAGAAAGQAFAGISHIRFSRLMFPESTDKLADIQFLVDGVGGGADCSPDTALRDVLVQLMGYSDSDIVTNVGPDGVYASSAQAYWAAMASTIRLNCTIEGAPLDVLDSLLEAVNCEAVKSGGQLKIYPLGDQAVGSYTPCSTAYTIGAQDVQVDGLIHIEAREDSECYNVQQVTYKDASDSFAEKHYTYGDDFDVARNGYREAGAISNDWVNSSLHAQALAQWKVRNYLHNRRRLTFTLTPRYGLLEPGDLLTVSDGLDLPALTCRIVGIEEKDDYNLEIEAWEWSGVTHPVDLTPETPAQPIETPTLASVEAVSAWAYADAAHSFASGATTDAGVAQGTADLRATGDNLFPNPTSETEPPYGADLTLPEWANRYQAGASPASYAGTWVRLVDSGGAASAELDVDVPAGVGEQFYFEAQIKRANGTGYGMLYLGALDANRAWLGGIESAHVTAGWTKVSCTYTLPAGACYVYAVLNSSGSSTAVLFDQMLLRRVVQPNQISKKAIRHYEATMTVTRGATIYFEEAEPDTNYAAFAFLKSYGGTPPAAGTVDGVIMMIMKFTDSVAISAADVPPTASSRTYDVTIIRGAS